MHHGLRMLIARIQYRQAVAIKEIGDVSSLAEGNAAAEGNAGPGSEERDINPAALGYEKAERLFRSALDVTEWEMDRLEAEEWIARCHWQLRKLRAKQSTGS